MYMILVNNGKEDLLDFVRCLMDDQKENMKESEKLEK